MAESSTYAFRPDFADLVRESAERALVLPRTIDYERLDSIIRSANFALADLHKAGYSPFELERVTQVTTAGMTSFSLPVRAARVFTATITRDGVEIPLQMIARIDYERIPSKSVQGHATQIFIDESGTGSATRTAYIWPAAENSTDTINLWIIRKPMDLIQLGEDVGISSDWIDAFCNNLAMRIAEKYNPQLYAMRKSVWTESLADARMHSRDRAPLRLRVSRSHTRLV
jgi:hypothetical protein